MPPVLAVISVAPELNVNEVLFVPVNTDVPISIVAPLATLNCMAQVEVVTCDEIVAVGEILTVCTPLPVKLNATVEPD